MKIYLAGPMTGYEQLNYPAFAGAAEHLRAIGHEVVSPAELNPIETEYADAMRNDIRALLDCEAIATLPGYEKSKGATLEFHIATVLGFLHFPIGCDTAKGETVYFVPSTARRLE